VCVCVCVCVVCMCVCVYVCMMSLCVCLGMVILDVCVYRFGRMLSLLVLSAGLGLEAEIEALEKQRREEFARRYVLLL
jgi:hypothetical protein